MSLTHPWSFAIALAMAAMAIAVLHRRGRPVLLTAFGAFCITLAAGGPTLTRHPPIEIDVMIDLSPSTRGALYRHQSTLRHRVEELNGSNPVRWLSFSDHVQKFDIDNANDAIDELPCDQTNFAPPGDAPILMFSDGNFSLSAPSRDAIYPVIDPLLSGVSDSAIERLTADAIGVRATVRASRFASVLWTGTSRTQTTPADGTTMIDGGTAKSAEISAHIDGRDRWPENDSMSTFAAPPVELQQWWVGDGVAPAGWIAL
ncbi:MAG: hypothetical protein JO353_07840, partial [Phycisphaerae bacterium]|nr:hypothetical protein [Phycisphaerae bacterium]